MMREEIVLLTDLAASRRAAFGEYLVEQRVIDRFQLLRALQLQDAAPGTQLGQCATALGFCRPETVEILHARFAANAAFDAMPTESFEREMDIEMTWPA